MAKIIKLNLNTSLGEVLAQIEKSEETEIVLESADNVDLTDTIDNIKRFGAKVGKTVNVKNTQNFTRAGFVTGEDITTATLPTITQSKNIAKKISFKKPNIKLDFFAKFLLLFKGNKIVFYLIPGSLLLVLGIFFYLLFYKIHAASIDLSVNPRVFTASKTVLVYEDTQPSTNNVSIKGTSISKTQTDTIEGVPTGEKETGTQANGKIKIFNKTDEDKTIKSGTEVVITSNDTEFVFTTDKEVKVLAKTTQEIEDNGEIKKADVFGSIEVGITASNFGDKYNLNKSDIKESNIKITNLKSSEFSAELTESTKGGTIKKVTAVLQKDIDQLVDDLQKRLDKKLTSDLENLAVKDEKVLSGGINIVYKQPVTTAKVGDEAEKIEVSITGTADTLKFDESELKLKLIESIKSDLPKEYTANEDSFEIYETVKNKNISATSQSVNSLELLVKVENKIVPNVDVSKIQNDLAGISFEEATNYLEKIENVQDIKVTQTPNIPFLIKSMPKTKENIKIQFKVVD